MDHLLLRLGTRRILIADVCSSADGHGVGYGILLKRIDKVLMLARAAGASVFYSREATAINTAVFRLSSEEVRVLPQSGWQAGGLRAVWAVTAPFRLRSPWLWAKRLIARALLGSFHDRLERSPRVPRAVRQFVGRPRPLYERLRRANGTYAERSAAAWKHTYMQHVYRPLRVKGRGVEAEPPRLWLPPDREREAVAQASVLGIGPADRIVTVHVRETGYRSAAGLRQRDWDVVRNARIETYVEAFTALVARGYVVVRLGDPTMAPVELAGVVDLATSPERTEWLEAWCVLRSEFLIGCDSGPSWLAVLAGVPVLTVNAIHFRDIARPTDRFICKLARDRSTGETLSLLEMLTERYLRTGLDMEKYEHLDNTPKDIAQAMLDMIDVMGGEERLSLPQRRFNRALVALGRELPRDWSGLEGIGCIRRPRGALSRRFAKKYLERRQVGPAP
ncbi:MAG: hypothetical protein A3H29_01095 [Acidobacteria bacterium RIFCSPLOWO2_02_FULL_67_21]|nr:MAG: hypothetical protein A3H29_01095 [Acidobacteria bacterium RIFCSPLOWO2_02_FULL_67_21]